MHFQDMEYRRPPLDATVGQIRDLTERMRQAESYAQARKVFLESEAFFRRLDTLSELGIFATVSIPEIRFIMQRRRSGALPRRLSEITDTNLRMRFAAVHSVQNLKQNMDC